MTTNKDHIYFLATQLEKNFVLANGINTGKGIDSLRGGVIDSLTSNLKESEYTSSIIDAFRLPPLKKGEYDKNFLVVILQMFGLHHTVLDEVLIVGSDSDDGGEIYFVTVAEYLLAKGGDLVETRSGNKRVSIVVSPRHLDEGLLYSIRTAFYDRKFVKEAFAIISSRGGNYLEIARNISSHYNSADLATPSIPPEVYDRKDRDSIDKVKKTQEEYNKVLLVMAHDNFMFSTRLSEVNFNSEGYSGSIESRGKINEMKEGNIRSAKAFLKFFLDDGMDENVLKFQAECVDDFINEELSEGEKYYLSQKNTLSTIWGVRIDCKSFVRYANYPDTIFTLSTVLFEDEQQKNILRKIAPLSKGFHEYEKEIISSPAVEDNDYLLPPEQFIVKKTNKLIKDFSPESNLNANSQITVSWEMRKRPEADSDGRVSQFNPYPQKPSYHGTVIDIITRKIELEKITDNTVKGYSISGISPDLKDYLNGYDIYEKYLMEVTSYTDLKKDKLISKIASLIRSTAKNKDLGCVSLNTHGIIPGVIIYKDTNKLVAHSVFDGEKYFLPLNARNIEFTGDGNHKDKVGRDFYIWLQDYVSIKNNNKKLSTDKLPIKLEGGLGPVTSRDKFRINIQKAPEANELARVFFGILTEDYKSDIDYLTKSDRELRTIKACQAIKVYSLLAGFITAPLSPLAGFLTDLAITLIINSIEASVTDTEEEAGRVLNELCVDVALTTAFFISPYIAKKVSKSIRKALSKVSNENKKNQARLAINNFEEKLLTREGIKRDTLTAKLKALFFDSRGGDFCKIFKYNQIDGGALFKQRKITGKLNDLIKDYKPDGYCRGLSIFYLVNGVNGKPAAEIIESIEKSFIKFKNGGGEDVDYIIKNQLNQRAYFSPEKGSSKFFHMVPNSTQSSIALHNSYLREKGAIMIGDLDSGVVDYHRDLFKRKKYFSSKGSFLLESDNHAMALSFDHGRGTFFDPNCGAISFTISDEGQYNSLIDNIFDFIHEHYSDAKWGSSYLCVSRIGKMRENPLVTTRSGLSSRSLSRQYPLLKGSNSDGGAEFISDSLPVGELPNGGLSESYTNKVVATVSDTGDSVIYHLPEATLSVRRKLGIGRISSPQEGSNHTDSLAGRRRRLPVVIPNSFDVLRLGRGTGDTNSHMIQGSHLTNTRPITDTYGQVILQGILNAQPHSKTKAGGLIGGMLVLGGVGIGGWLHELDADKARDVLADAEGNLSDVGELINLNELNIVSIMQQYFRNESLLKSDLHEMILFIRKVRVEATDMELSQFLSGQLPNRFEEDVPYILVSTPLDKLLGFYMEVFGENAEKA